MTSDKWTPPPLPEELRSYGVTDVANQRVPWTPTPWVPVFSGHQAAFDALCDHALDTNGIARGFVHSLAGGEPVDLFLGAMAWGFGNVRYGPARVQAMLRDPSADANLRAIVRTVRSTGAGLGWRALLATHKVKGLGVAFGTKLLYFAGYQVCEPPKPLILDRRVHASLERLAPCVLPPPGKTVWRADYLRYLETAVSWAADPTWDQEPDVVELALFGGPRAESDGDSTEPDGAGD